MKKAFTLAEALIVLLIVGIISAIMIPAINKAKPDETKVQYLKTYSTLEKAIKSLAHNSEVYSLYGRDASGNEKNYSEVPLANLRYNNNDDPAKLCKELAKGFEQSEAGCSAQETQFNGNWSFRTSDGKDIFVSAMDTDHWRTQIVFDIDGANNGNNCDVDNCPNPDRFMVWVYADGTVQPGDRMGAGYLNSRRHWLGGRGGNAGNVINILPRDCEGGECLNVSCNRGTVDNNTCACTCDAEKGLQISQQGDRCVCSDFSRMYDKNQGKCVCIEGSHEDDNGNCIPNNNLEDLIDKFDPKPQGQWLVHTNQISTSNASRNCNKDNINDTYCKDGGTIMLGSNDEFIFLLDKSDSLSTKSDVYNKIDLKFIETLDDDIENQILDQYGKWVKYWKCANNYFEDNHYSELKYVPGNFNYVSFTTGNVLDVNNPRTNNERVQLARYLTLYDHQMKLGAGGGKGSPELLQDGNGEEHLKIKE